MGDVELYEILKDILDLIEDIEPSLSRRAHELHLKLDSAILAAGSASRED